MPWAVRSTVPSKSPPHTSRFEHGALVAGKLVGLQRQRLCLAQQGQVARHGGHVVAVERELVGDELDGGVLAASNRSALCRCLSKAGVPVLMEVASKVMSTLPVLPRAVELDGAFLLVKTTAVDRSARNG